MTYLELVIIDRFLKDIESSPLELRYGVVNAYKAFLEACILRGSLKMPEPGQQVGNFPYPATTGTGLDVNCLYPPSVSSMSETTAKKPQTMIL